MISILMGTYNGEKYLHQQIDSLLIQTEKNFTLHICDDASTDGTWEILSSYAEKFPEKIKISQRQKNSGSPKHNFLDLMLNIKDDYVMLCDQDDVWLPNKIEVTLAKMKETENAHPNTPVLIRTDQYVVDQNLQMINTSYIHAMHSNFERTAFHQALIQNTFAGCTGMYNRKLADLIFAKPDYCIMFDWWLKLVAAAFGKIENVYDATMLYRQHGKNVVGVKDFRKLSYKLKRLFNKNDIKDAIYITFRQAESFLEIYEKHLSDNQKHILKKYCNIPNSNKLKRWKTICEIKSFKYGIGRNIAYFLFV
jgi:glycosyltransferase involved in cell wall biosynthesis